MENDGVVHPEQLAMLTEALDVYCRDAGIKPDTPEYEMAGHRVIALFENGAQTAEQLLAALLPSERKAS
jgi:hypothetical protein